MRAVSGSARRSCPATASRSKAKTCTGTVAAVRSTSQALVRPSRPCRRSKDPAPRSSSAINSPSMTKSSAGRCPAAAAISGNCAVTSRPLRARNCGAPPSRRTISTRMPSYLSSNTQPARVKGSSTTSASIGDSARAGRTARGAPPAAACAARSASRRTPSRNSVTVRPDTTDCGIASTGSLPPAAASAFLKNSHWRPSSPFVRTRAQRPRSLWPRNSRSSLPDANAAPGSRPSTRR